MGIYIKLESVIRTPPLDIALARLRYTYEAIRYFAKPGFFLPKKVAIWLKAPTESLGGTLKDEIAITEYYQTIEMLRAKFIKTFYQDELFSSVVVFNGTWRLNGLEFEGFISANNDFMWNRAYQDIEIDAYGKGEFEDLVEIFWKIGDIPHLVTNFINELRRVEVGKGQVVKPTIIYFSIGAPEHGEVENLIALHLRDRRSMIEFLYGKLRRDKDSWIENKVAPLDRYFYLSSITEHEIVQSMFNQISKETLLVEKMGRSVTYIAEKRDSFSEFYRKFKEAVFKRSSQELLEADIIRKNIKKGLERTESLG